MTLLSGSELSKESKTPLKSTGEDPPWFNKLWFNKASNHETQAALVLIWIQFFKNFLSAYYALGTDPSGGLQQ